MTNCTAINLGNNSPSDDTPLHFISPFLGSFGAAFWLGFRCVFLWRSCRCYWCWGSWWCFLLLCNREKRSKFIPSVPAVPQFYHLENVFVWVPSTLWGSALDWLCSCLSRSWMVSSAACRASSALRARCSALCTCSSELLRHTLREILLRCQPSVCFIRWDRLTAALFFSPASVLAGSVLEGGWKQRAKYAIF